MSLQPSPSPSDIATAFAGLTAKLRELRPDVAVTTQPATTDAAVVEETAMALADVRQKAAVVGWFKPATLLDTVPRRQRERVLTALVGECDVQSRGRDRVWRLGLQPRREELRLVAQDQKVRARVLRATSHLALDRESLWLRQALGGKSIDPKRVRPGELPALLQVGEWTEHILPNAPKTADVRGLLAQQAIEDSLGVLLHRFHGRETELDTEAVCRPQRTFGARACVRCEWYRRRGQVHAAGTVRGITAQAPHAQARCRSDRFRSRPVLVWRSDRAHLRAHTADRGLVPRTGGVAHRAAQQRAAKPALEWIR